MSSHEATVIRGPLVAALRTAVGQVDPDLPLYNIRSFDKVRARFLVGLPASFAVARITSSLLFGVSPTSPHVFAFTGVLLGIVVMTATMLPARRAARVNPVVALKE